MIIYHGSKVIVEKPLFGYGKTTNDYGQGFYCTEDVELAREWACMEEKGGFVSTYSLNTDGLKVLKLNDRSIIEWIAILLENRHIRYSSPIERRTAEYIISHFLPVTDKADIITGYRADDSYFSYARAFLSNTISLQQLADALKFGNLGMQIFIKSRKAFDRISFVESEMVSGDEYYLKRIKRDDEARDDFNRLLEKDVSDGIYVRDILSKRMSINELFV